MFFRKKGWLRKEYDEKLLDQLKELKDEWKNQKSLIEKVLILQQKQLVKLSLLRQNIFICSRKQKKKR